MPVIENEIDLTKVDQIIAEIGAGKGILIPVLQKVQDHYGYLPEEVIRRVAEKLKISLAQVYGVATFYSQFYLEKRGKNIIKFCDGTACHVKGAVPNIKFTEQKLGINRGETTDDYKFTLEVVYCLGACALAPVAIVNGHVVGKITPEKIDNIIENA